MDILKIGGVIFLTLCLTWVLKIRESRFSSLLSMLAVTAIGVYAISHLKPILDLSGVLINYTENGNEIFTILLKVCGIGILTQGVTVLCNESGERSLATAMEITADVATLLLALPMFEDVYRILADLLKTV